MKTHNIIINTKTKKYPIVIGSNIIRNISKILFSQKINFEKCLIVSDNNIPIKLKSNLINNINVKSKIIYNFTASEKNKNYKNVEKIHNILFVYHLITKFQLLRRYRFDAFWRLTRYHEP